MSTYVPVALRRRVEAGAAHLDATFPEWLDIIDLETFDLTQPCRCVLGQIVKSVDPSADYYNLDVDAPLSTSGEEPVLPEVAMSHETAIARGFHTVDALEDDDDEREWALLQLHWRRLIVARRKAAQVAQ